MDEPAVGGRSFPLGASLCDGGANFSVFAKHSPLEDGPIVPFVTYRVQPRSLVILFAKSRADAMQSTTAGGHQP